ncbi:hypothetical protein L207DRAFT_641460, partial [Hyaloscypha variabilis F]
MSRSPTPGGVEKPKISLKSHRKSRKRCDNCKRRRIKCNEEWPICSNCTQHSDQCSFSTRSRPSGPPSNVTTLKLGEDLMDFGHPSRSSSLAIATDTPKSALDSRLESVFSLVDLELLHNYETLTSHTLSGIPQMQTFMRVD